jgi:protease IV
MLQFLKYVLATIIGLFLFFIVSFFIMVGIGSAFSSSNETTEVKESSVLKLDLNASISEISAKADPFEEIFGEGPARIGLNQIKTTLANAKIDPKIKAISIKLEYPMAGFATLKEIRDALIDFKKSGKPIYTYAELMTEKAIYLASVADKSYLNPAGGLEFNGLDSEITFLKGMFDKVGVKPIIFKVGDFKSAVEPYTRSDMSPENKLQVNSYLNSIANQMYGEISKSRNIPRTELDNILNKALIQSPEDAVKYKLITNVGYEDEFEDAIRGAMGLKKDAKITYIKYGTYKDAKSLLKEGSRDNRIAVIVAEGEIISGEGNNTTIGSESFLKEIRKARKDKKIKAIVLRINSPGGSALASDVMWREIQLTKKVKPVIASMGNVAASGGYYMAMGCDTIVAQPNTITGSIGVFGMLFNAKELMNNKLGITFDGVKTHDFADSPSLTREMSDAEKMLIQNSVNQIYEQFTSKAAQGRKMPIEKLKSVASGRVWTGEQAKENGLVDVLGGIDQAIEIAAKKANLKKEDYQVKYYPYPKSDFEQIMDRISKKQEDAKIKEYLGVFAPLAEEFKSLQRMEKIQARLPYSLEIK